MKRIHQWGHMSGGILCCPSSDVSPGGSTGKPQAQSLLILRISLQGILTCSSHEICECPTGPGCYSEWDHLWEVCHVPRQIQLVLTNYARNRPWISLRVIAAMLLACLSSITSCMLSMLQNLLTTCFYPSKGLCSLRNSAPLPTSSSHYNLRNGLA